MCSSSRNTSLVLMPKHCLPHLWPRRRTTALRGEVTGCAKTALLDALAAEGAQVLDLEGAANHRGSILGDAPGGVPQPTQRLFVRPAPARPSRLVKREGCECNGAQTRGKVGGE